MQKTIQFLLITALACSQAYAHSDTATSSSPVQQLGQALVNKKYEQLKNLYGSYNPFKKAWFRPKSQEHLSKRLALASAKGDTALAAQISKLGYQNKIEQIIPHALWEHRATILLVGLIALKRTKTK